MRELKTYISEGFFSNVGANNRIKLAIDTIKDASMNDKIDSISKRLEFTNLLTSILKDIETDIKKGKFIFKYTRADDTCAIHEVTVSLEMTEPNKAIWLYSNKNGKYYVMDANVAAFDIAVALYYEALCPTKESSLRHSIAKTIKIVELKLS